MLLNRKYINELKARIEFLEKDIESKENSVCNVLEANKELSLSNNYFENKIQLQNKVIIELEEKERELQAKLSRAEGKLDRLENYIRMLTGREVE